MKKFERFICLLICFVLIVLIIPPEYSLLYISSIMIMIGLIVYGMFSKPERKNVNKEAGSVSIKSMLLSFYCDLFTIVIVMAVIYIVSRSFSLEKSSIYIFYLTCFIFLTRDVLFTGLGSKLTKLTYDYSISCVNYKILAYNFFYFLVIWIPLLQRSFGFSNDITKNILIVLLLTLSLDQFYLFFIGKNQTLFGKVIGVRVYKSV
jgi:hypothetical protein